jgi:hypothetical protein
METSGSSPSADKDTIRILFVRRFFTRTAIVSLIFMILCLVAIAASKSLYLNKQVSRVLLESLYAGALGLFISAASKFCLDIMYGILGLLQAKVSRLFSWFVISILSLLPIAAIFAIMRLASGFQA